MKRKSILTMTATKIIVVVDVIIMSLVVVVVIVIIIITTTTTFIIIFSIISIILKAYRQRRLPRFIVATVFDVVHLTDAYNSHTRTLLLPY